MRFEANTLYLSGELTRHTVSDLLTQLERIKPERLGAIDLAEVEFIDSAGVAFLDELHWRFRTDAPRLVNIGEDISDAIDTFSDKSEPISGYPHQENFILRIGAFLYKMADTFVEGLYLFADIAFWSVHDILSNKGQRKGSVIQQSLLIGVDAVGIIALLSLVLGLIIALQSAAQLRQFGVGIFIADLISISMVREMGPMITAIILAGRSGSAIASEIASMKISEEVDALKMMAINPIRFVVVPKMHAITICMPLLVTMSILIGIAGGLLIAVTYLNLSVVSYYNQALNALILKDIVVGLGKSVVFAWVIVAVGSYYGFRVSGGAEDVGKATTQSVVASIFYIILLNAIFSLIFYFG